MINLMHTVNMIKKANGEAELKPKFSIMLNLTTKKQITESQRVILIAVSNLKDNASALTVFRELNERGYSIGLSYVRAYLISSPYVNCTVKDAPMTRWPDRTQKRDFYTLKKGVKIISTLAQRREFLI